MKRTRSPLLELASQTKLPKEYGGKGRSNWLKPGLGLISPTDLGSRMGRQGKVTHWCELICVWQQENLQGKSQEATLRHLS